MTAAALQELGPNPFAALRAAFAGSQGGPERAQPSTPAEAAKGPAVEEIADVE
jgi:hypothetical protein